jgi:AcrR family transcriptional regulator
MDSKKKLIRKAYEHFGLKGPIEISRQKISDELSMPRTIFYYYFVDKEDLIEQLLSEHKRIVEIYIEALKTQVKTFLPDLHELNIKFIPGFRFHQQLFFNRTNPHYNLAYIHSNKACNPTIIPLLMEYYNLHSPYSVVESLWETVLDSWYSRLNCDRMSVIYCSKLTKEIMDSVMGINHL